MALVVLGFGVLEGVKNHELEEAIVVVVVALTMASMLTLVLIWH